MSCSGRLVIQINRLECFDCTRSEPSHERMGSRCYSGIRPGIKNNVSRDLTWEIEHVVKTPRQRSLRKKVPARIRVVNKLQEEGIQQATDISFGGILEVEVVVRDKS